MMTLFGDPAIWLPLAFAALMGLAILVYVMLDGYDLGVGLLFPFAEPAERDRMVASIGPFWDANETWLVQGVLTTQAAVGEVPPAMVASTLIAYLVVYAVLLAAYVGVLVHMIRKQAAGADPAPAAPEGGRPMANPFPQPAE